MVKLKVEVDDWDTGESTELELPCNVRNYVDTTHELQIIDWETDISIGYYDEVEKLSNLLDDINAETPAMTLEILTAILNATTCSELNDKEFVRKICSSDYMLEEFTLKNKNKEERCAKYLALEMMIPFARNITTQKLNEMALHPERVKWNRVWEHYSNMGFQIIRVGKKFYAFHWGDAVT